MTETSTTFDVANFRGELLQFITESKFLMAVSMGQDGYPMARTLGYLNDEFAIWLYTTTNSLKIRQFRASPKITLLWRENTPQFFKFLTMKGNLELFEDQETIDQVWERYQDKYPQMRGRQTELLQQVVIKVTPIYLRAEGFGVAPPPVLREF
ncbi:MAG: pyridoxamine 5'-phosphate oxidase family protein [Chloroflexota bacterium]|nr:pyridoxamine 5'-phosphate oxidase family protein [Chloroflexota bacterium]